VGNVKQKRAVIASMIQQLDSGGRMISDLAEAKQWASELNRAVFRGRAKGKVGAVQDIRYYKTRTLAVQKLCDKSRSRVVRAAAAGGIGRELLRRTRLKREEFVRAFKVDDAGLIREIIRVFDQGRTNFGAEQPWALDLVRTRTDGGERNNCDRQTELLAFLASYGPSNPDYTLAAFPLVTRIFRTAYWAERWLDFQQGQIVKIDQCPAWKLFRKLCAAGDLDHWFCELCAHQWFLYRTGYFLERANYFSSYIRQHMIFYGPSSPEMDTCLEQIDGILFEFHLRLSDLRFITTEQVPGSGELKKKPRPEKSTERME